MYIFFRASLLPPPPKQQKDNKKKKVIISFKKRKRLQVGQVFKEGYIFRWGTQLHISLFSVRLSVAHHISGTVHHLIVIFGTQIQNGDISRFLFHFFKNFDFLGCYGGKRAKNNPKRKITITSICHAAYLRNGIAYDHDFWYACVK